MKTLSLAFTGLAFAHSTPKVTAAFVPASPIQNIPHRITACHFRHPIADCPLKSFQLFSTKDNQETEVERLLRKARELAAEAAVSEQELHDSLLEKKSQKDAETDAQIEILFPTGSCDVEGLVERLRTKRCSTDMLLRIVERLHEREIAAKGLEHVEPSLHHDHTKFKTVAEVDKVELARVEGLIDRLIEAAKVLDEEWTNLKREKGENYATHTEAEHWTAGECAAHLTNKVREMRREHEEHFQKRLNSFYEAQRKKDLDAKP